MTVRRSPEAVIESLLRLLPEASPERLRKDIIALDRKLDQLEHRWRDRMGLLRIEFSDLSLDACGELLFEFLELGPLPNGWWPGFAKMNLQYPITTMANYYSSNAQALQRLATAATTETKRQLLVKRRKRKHPLDGFDIAEESFDSFFTSGTTLFAEHVSQIGDHPESWTVKNWPQMRALALAGQLQIITARCNGRMMGYLLTMLSPSLEQPGILSGINTAQFVSSDAPVGLGRHISDAAIEALRAKSVDELWLRAGTKGDGPRLAPLYDRMGASREGTLHRLNLNGHPTWA